MGAYESVKPDQQGGNEQGIAMLTVMLLLLIMTVLGYAALTVTGFENRVAGLATSTEMASTAAESCIGISVSILQDTIDQGRVPLAYLGGNPVPNAAESTATPPTLTQEILGQFDAHTDLETGVGAMGPDMQLSSVGGFTVTGDIDRLYAKNKSGGSLQFASGNEGTGKLAAIDIYYQVTCAATNVATGTKAQATAIYACTAAGDTCQRKL